MNDESEPGQLHVGIGRIRLPRTADLVADRFRDSILSGEIPAGTTLPPERQLAMDAGVGRASVREALKTLVLEGLVTVKVGRQGGYVVQQPARDAVIRTLDLFIRGRRVTQEALLEIREMVEPECAAMAARRRTDAGVARLRELTERMGQATDVQDFLDQNIEWHALVAELSGNDVLAAFMTAISTNIRALTGADAYDSPEMLRAAHKLHTRVTQAIDAGDDELARQHMQHHIHAASQVVRTPAP